MITTASDLKGLGDFRCWSWVRLWRWTPSLDSVGGPGDACLRCYVIRIRYSYFVRDYTYPLYISKYVRFIATRADRKAAVLCKDTAHRASQHARFYPPLSSLSSIFFYTRKPQIILHTNWKISTIYFQSRIVCTLAASDGLLIAQECNNSVLRFRLISF